MTRLVDALRTENTVTENGMVTNSSSLNACVDLFFVIGAMRGQDVARLISKFSKAFNESPVTALRILFWARDARSGAGERKIFRDILKYLAETHSESLAKNIEYIPEFGRWDDVLTLFGTSLDTQAKSLIMSGLNANNGLCAKWMPRKGKHAIALEKHLNLSPKGYRKMLVEKTNVVETAMCARDWSAITYNHVPSLAMSRYTKAFAKNDGVRFDQFKNSATTIKADALYPYDILKSLKYGGDATVGIKQWASLPNYLTNTEERILPVCDVSGSMSTPAGNNPNLSCMDVCVSLGLYISERNVGKFKDAFITFSSNPQLQYLTGNIVDRMHQLSRADWGMSTNLEATFSLVLNQAIKHSLPEDEMPTTILIMSDMEFNQATRSHETAMKMIERQYNEAGYTIPKIVFWNIQSRQDNIPVSFDKNGTALVSGFSPAILKSLLAGEDFTPVAIMNKTVNSERYACITA
jgi:hypothetical protein